MECGHPTCVRTLMDAYAPVELKDQLKMYAAYYLCAAAQLPADDVLGELLRHDTLASRVDAVASSVEDGHTALAVAASNGSLPCTPPSSTATSYFLTTFPFI